MLGPRVSLRSPEDADQYAGVAPAGDIFRPNAFLGVR